MSKKLASALLLFLTLLGVVSVFSDHRSDAFIPMPLGQLCDPAPPDTVSGAAIDGSVLEAAGVGPAPLGGVLIRITELGIETLTDGEGGFRFCDLGLAKNRLVTLAARKQGYSSYTLKNFVVGPSRSFVPAIYLYRDGPAIVEDFCGFEDGPSLSAALAEMRDVPCRQFDLGPAWFLTGCPAHALRQAQGAGGGPLVGITGILLGPRTAGGIKGASIEIRELGLVADTDERGCFGLSPIEVNADPGRPKLVDLSIVAEGYRPLFLKHLPMFGNVGFDAVLEQGIAAQVIDRCVFTTDPASRKQRATAAACQEIGALVRLPSTGGPPPESRKTLGWLLSIGFAVVLTGFGFISVGLGRRVGA